MMQPNFTSSVSCITRTLCLTPLHLRTRVSMLAPSSNKLYFNFQLQYFNSGGSCASKASICSAVNIQGCLSNETSVSSTGVESQSGKCMASPMSTIFVAVAVAESLTSEESVDDGPLWLPVLDVSWLSVVLKFKPSITAGSRCILSSLKNLYISSDDLGAIFSNSLSKMRVPTMQLLKRLASKSPLLTSLPTSSSFFGSAIFHKSSNICRATPNISA
mmetsp:Transcript_13622/g.22473  ORF Transcript_13622/g.22473 Transcript_13622/m.22473 type:complete len:217 (+) Transcript_13622:1554-2204(+)